MDSRARPMLFALRISLGFVFLWAFLDKLLGLGFGTCKDAGALCSKAWLSGGSPTTGFLGGTEGIFSPAFRALAGVALVDWLFMLGLLGIGIALFAGAGMRLAAYSGSLLLLLMWLAELPLANNPLVDDHIVYALVLLLLAWSDAGDIWGLGSWWKRQPVVQRLPWLA